MNGQSFVLDESVVDGLWQVRRLQPTPCLFVPHFDDESVHLTITTQVRFSSSITSFEAILQF